MPAYRFCRTDDIRFLADAVNACYVVHFPDQVELSADDFKREIRELDIWCSSCMVALADGDPIVREAATLAAIQIYRFRALRLAELDQAHLAVEKLATFDNRAAVAPLIEVMSQYRTGYLSSPTGMVEGDNGKARMVALIRLVEWHTPDAQLAIQALRFDRDSNLVKAAVSALEYFPGEWKGPIKKP